MERRLIRDYRKLLARVMTDLSPVTLNTATRLAALPEKIRRYGHVKIKSLETVEKEQQRLLEQFETISVPLHAQSNGAA